MMQFVTIALFLEETSIESLPVYIIDCLNLFFRMYTGEKQKSVTEKTQRHLLIRY
jgi:hypothetical protein